MNRRSALFGSSALVVVAATRGTEITMDGGQWRLLTPAEILADIEYAWQTMTVDHRGKLTPAMPARYSPRDGTN